MWSVNLRCKDKEDMSQELYDTIKAINQIAADAFDGSEIYLGDKHTKPGMKREEGDWVLDKRIIDGFNVRIAGNRLCLLYQTDVPLDEFEDPRFKQNMADRIYDLANYLKKEYKKQVGKGLTLKPLMDEPRMLVQTTSTVRYFLIGEMMYEIGSIKLDEQNEFDFNGLLREFREESRERCLEQFYENGSFYDQLMEATIVADEESDFYDTTELFRKLGIETTEE
jgi:hypothetical protein